MHPVSLAVILSSSSIAGLGLLAVLGLLSAAGFLTSNPWLGVFAIGVAVVLIALELVAALFNLGRPEKTFDALAQWPSPWPSRTRLFAKITLVAAIGFGIGWGGLGNTDGIWMLAGVAAIILSMVTVTCSAMIYGCLRPVRQWFEWWTAPSIITFSVMGGSLLLSPIAQVMGEPNWLIKYLPSGTVVFAWFFNVVFWDYALNMWPRPHAVQQDGDGSAPSLEFPQTGENYLIKEAVFDAARRRTHDLRRFVHLTAFAIPLTLTLIGTATHGTVATVMALGAVISFVVGALADRWQFYAEAKHTVSVPYEVPGQVPDSS